MKQLLFILDGLCEPTGSRTTLEEAHTPFLDRLARAGTLHCLDLQPETGTHGNKGLCQPTSERGILRLLGFSQDSPIPPRASLLSCLFPFSGNGQEKPSFALLLNPARFNFRGELEDYVGSEDSIVRLWSFFRRVLPGQSYLDRRSGIEIYPLRDDARDSIQRLLLKIPEESCPPLPSEGFLSPEKGMTRAHNIFSDWVGNVLAPLSDCSGTLNGWWSWGGGPWRYQSGGDLVNRVMISGVAIGKAIGAFLGYRVPAVPGATGDVDTAINAKLSAARQAFLSGNSHAVVHIEGFDLASHRQNRSEKKTFLERFDRESGPFLLNLLEEGIVNTVHFTSDHCSSPATGNHTGGPVPVLSVQKEDISNGIQIKTTKSRFTEINANHSDHWSIAHWQKRWIDS